MSATPLWDYIENFTALPGALLLGHLFSGPYPLQSDPIAPLPPDTLRSPFTTTLMTEVQRKAAPGLGRVGCEPPPGRGL